MIMCAPYNHRDRARHPAEELETDVVPLGDGFAALRRIGLNQTAVAVRQVHRKKSGSSAQLRRSPPALRRSRLAHAPDRVATARTSRAAAAAARARGLYDRDPASIPM